MDAEDTWAAYVSRRRVGKTAWLVRPRHLRPFTLTRPPSINNMTLSFHHQGERINKTRIAHKFTSTAGLERCHANYLMLAEAVESYSAYLLHH
jgi:hypothetical protein